MLEKAMTLNNKGKKRRLWAVVPPWLIIGAVVILVPLFILMTLENINRQREQTTLFLVEKGASLIRSLEAGARTGIGLRWGGFQFQKLLMETAREPNIDYLIVTDIRGTILADSDPSRLGMDYGLDLDLQKISSIEKIAWRQVPNNEGADTFEIYGRFLPMDTGPPPGFPDPMLTEPAPGNTEPTGFVIFVGLDMGPILAARQEEQRRIIWMAALFLLIGFAGFVSLMLAQGYRTARSSLSRIKAFSDSLVENIPIGLATFDTKGTLTTLNQTAELILDLKSAEVIGKPAEAILPGSLGEIFLELTTMQRFIEREADCSVTEKRTIPLEVIATVLHEDEGAFLGYVILFRDMTEMRRLQQEIARSQRLASLGSLAAGVAHEIRNPLSSLKGFATYFRERYHDNPADRETAEVMIKEVDRLNRVITQLLEFARPMAMTLAPVAMQVIIRHALKTVENQARDKGIIMELELPPEMVEIPVDADRISQVLMNLFLNSIAATERGGLIRVTLARQDERMIRISVTDTGAGIKKEDLPRIFDPYFTTKPSGTGLGLPIVQKIVEAHNGKIVLASQQGKGTTATVHLPMQSLHEGV
jgi:two-component system sensor histidine kinase HydH